MRARTVSSAFWIPVGIFLGLSVEPSLAVPVYVDTGIRIPVPASPNNGNAGGSFTSYDIMWFDGNTQLVYVADRSNASVDVFSAKTNSFVGRIGGVGNEFVGQNPPPPAAPTTAISGPDGLVISNLPGQHNIYVGDGNSVLKAYNLDSAVVLNPALVAGARLPFVTTGSATTDRRVDEMAFDPVHNRLLVTNNAPTNGIPFSTLINTTGNANTIVTKITFDGTNADGHNGPNAGGAGGGAEQAVFDPTTGKFYLNLVQINGAGPGAVVRIDPTTGNVEKVYDLATVAGGLGAGGVCGPAGLAVDAAGKLLVGCGSGTPTGSIFLDPTANGGNGSIKTIPQVSGEDMVWYDPVIKLFFLAARNDLSGPKLGIVDDNGNWLQNLVTSPGAHSVAVDPVSGEAFVPFGGAGPGGVVGSQCALGCIAIFAAAPEPGTLFLLGVGVLGLVARRRLADAV